MAFHRGTDEADCARRGGVVYDHEHCENGRIDQDSGPRSSDERGTSVATAKQLLLLLLLLLMACAPSRHRLRLTSATDLPGTVQSVDRGSASVVVKISSRL